MSNTNRLENSELVDLVLRAKQGDETAFEELYGHYFTPIARYIYIRVGSEAEADDLTQQVFLKFYRNLNNWQDQGFQPSAYLYSIARSVIADYYRSNAKRGVKIDDSDELLTHFADTSQSPHNDVIQAEEVRELMQVLRTLPDHYQEVLLLRYMESLSSQDIAALIGKSDMATRQMLSRATKALAAAVKKNSEKQARKAK